MKSIHQHKLSLHLQKKALNTRNKVVVMIKKLPIDVSNFKTMIEDDYVYVDKTRHIHQLITQGRFYFLSRPRRFGKSLLVSTLKEIFLANKKLFETSWIGSSNYVWHKHPVIHLDFSSISHNDAENLRTNLIIRLKSIAVDYGVIVDGAHDPESIFYDLVKKLSLTGKVVVLIDEYDYPILKHITNTPLALEMQEVLRGFYTSIKGLDEYLKFVLLTGVTKFSRTSIFSGLNNLNDISLDLEGATLLGYTEHEIERYFTEHINYFAEKQKTSVNVIMKNMKIWYNGYRFSGNSVVEKIYNPFSVLYYLHKQQRKNYWFASGTPTFLVSLLKKNYYHKAIESFDRVTMTEDSLISFDISGDIPLNTLLFQTGYLTIKSYDARHAMYTLACPNQEVRISLTTLYL
jgi:hypothetical protein